MSIGRVHLRIDAAHLHPDKRHPMFQAWRMRLQEATKAVDCDRIEEALRLVEDHQLVQYGPGKELASKIAAKLLGRASARITQGDRGGAGIDLEEARRLQGETEAWLAARGALVDQTIAEARIRLAAGDPQASARLVDDAARIHPASTLVQRWRQVLGKVESARRSEEFGRFGEAESQLHAAVALEPQWEWLRDYRTRLRERGMTLDLLLEKLERQKNDLAWTEALHTAQQVAAISPEHPAVRETRQRASAADSPVNVPPTHYWPHAKRSPSVGSPMTSNGRLRLWIDGVGGYLICPQNRVTIGRGGPHSQADIALAAELSRQHAAIERRKDAYFLIAEHETLLNNKPVADEALLNDGDEITLGRSVRCEFERPHPWSMSARVNWLTRHRPQMAPDGVLLLADSIVLGRSSQSHVIVPHLPDEMILFVQGDQLMLRSKTSFNVDGRRCEGRVAVPFGSQITSDAISMMIEPDETPGFRLQTSG